MKTRKKHIPAQIHKIWVGSVLPEKYQQKIIADRKLLSDRFSMNLWVDKTVLDNNAYTAMVLFCKHHCIQLRDVSELGNFLNHQYFKDEVQHGKQHGSTTANVGYVSAADILRYAILEKHGGVYLDADDQLDATFTQQFNRAQQSPNTSFFYLLDPHRANNNFIIAARNATFIRRLNTKINRSYQKLYANPLLRNAYKSECGDLEGSVHCLTGPELLCRQMDKTQKLEKNVQHKSVSGMYDGIYPVYSRREYPFEIGLANLRRILFSYIFEFIKVNELDELCRKLYKGRNSIYSCFNDEDSDFKTIKIIVKFQNIIDQSNHPTLIKLFGSANLDILSQSSLERLQANVLDTVPMLSKQDQEALLNIIKPQHSTDPIETIVKKESTSADVKMVIKPSAAIWNSLIFNITNYIQSRHETLTTAFFRNDELTAAKVGLAKSLLHRIQACRTTGVNKYELQELIKKYQRLNDALEELAKPTADTYAMFDKNKLMIKKTDGTVKSLPSSDAPKALLYYLGREINYNRKQFDAEKHAQHFEAQLNELADPTRKKSVQKSHAFFKSGLNHCFTTCLQATQQVMVPEITVAYASPRFS